ncbi:MAG: hypothetical protein WC091_02700 [Sulfuricellaceae bacterium]
MPNRSSIIPASEKIVDKAGKVVIPWLLFFQQLINGDAGTSFVPEFTDLTQNGVATIGGVYYENAGFADFFVRITPSIDTSAVAGDTYFELPFQPTSDAPCFATTVFNSSLGGIVAATKRCYTPSWTSITTPITISGRVPLQA